MGVDGAGENDFFEVAAEAHEIVDALAVGDADDVLFDDGAFVEGFGDVVGGGADDFDAAVVGGVIGAGAGEGGQEGVVDVEDAHGEGLHKGGAENLHVAGQDDESAPASRRAWICRGSASARVAAVTGMC